MTVRIRRAEDDDEDTVLALQRECLPTTDPLPFEKAMWWLGYDGDAPVAFAALGDSVQFPKTRAYLARAGVLKDYRGLGLQKKLIRVRLREAKRLGYTEVVSDTVAENPASMRSLIACDFRPFMPDMLWGFERTVYWHRSLPACSAAKM